MLSDVLSDCLITEPVSADVIKKKKRNNNVTKTGFSAMVVSSSLTWSVLDVLYVLGSKNGSQW